jgi:GGDEF domain-containing protein
LSNQREAFSPNGKKAGSTHVVLKFLCLYADRGSVTDNGHATTLSRLSQRRFRSFSEAASEVIEALADCFPGVVALGRLDADERAHHVIEIRGDGLSLTRGDVLPLAGEGLDPAFVDRLGARSWLAKPLEMSDGSIRGVLCALSAEAQAFTAENEGEAGVAARLLAHEWENVELRSEVRRLRARTNAGPKTDPATGLPNREGFVELLNHEWSLAERGTVESILVACRVGSDDGLSSPPAAGVELAVKVAAEVLDGSARLTDRVGRVGDTTLAAVLIGCPLDDAPAFVARFLGALDRVTDGSRPIEVSCGVQPLSGTASPEEALNLSEAAAEPGRRTPDLAVEGAIE